MVLSLLWGCSFAAHFIYRLVAQIMLIPKDCLSTRGAVALLRLDSDICQLRSGLQDEWDEMVCMALPSSLGQLFFLQLLFYIHTGLNVHL